MPEFLSLEQNGTSGSLRSDGLNRDEGIKVLEQHHLKSVYRLEACLWSQASEMCTYFPSILGLGWHGSRTESGD